MDQRHEEMTSAAPLGPEERAAALALVRESVEALVREGRRLEPPGGHSLSSRRSAAFVTLSVGGRLRGCIGLLEPLGSLEQTLIHCAIAAAAEDRRFAPVSAGELPDLRYEISILSPLHPVPSFDEIEVGRHGVLIQARGRQGLLLPQVPVEHGWNRETYLENACRKAGLPRDALKWPDTRIWVFTAEVFGGETP
jgi:AmmeMemoRadiSam system protein A